MNCRLRTVRRFLGLQSFWSGRSCWPVLLSAVTLTACAEPGSATRSPFCFQPCVIVPSLFPLESSLTPPHWRHLADVLWPIGFGRRRHQHRHAAAEGWPT